MTLMYTPIDRITEADIQQLVQNEVPESRVLDYKENLTIGSGDEKREFLYDVTAFANSGGGELIFGISEVRINNQPTGKPSEVVGLQIENTDSLIRQLEELIRANVQPRIFGIQMRSIPLDSGKDVLVVRIPNSLNNPHMVSMGGTQRFYTRNSAGKHPMDITEIRSSILSSAGLSDKIRDLRLSRLSSIKNNNGFIEVKDHPYALAVHLVPFSLFSDELLDASTLKQQTSNLWPFYTTGMDYKYNFDGFITFANWPNDTFPHTYVQLTKQGMIESVESGGILREEPDGRKLIPSVYIEQKTMERVYGYLTALSNLGVRPPVVLMISLLGIKGFSLGISSSRLFGDEHNLIEQNDLLLPEILLESYPTQKDIPRLLKPAFDSLWNAAGFPSSLNYNENGEWVKRSH